MARLAAIVESSNDAIIGTMLDGTIISWNPAAERLYGYTASEAVGQSIAMLVPAGDINDTPELLGQVAQDERIQGYEARRQTKDGRILDVALTISPVHDSDGRILGVSAISRDVTELRRLQEDRDRLHSELEAEFQRTAEIQAQLLPQTAPDVAGYEFAGICLPARQVGGDFFDWLAGDDEIRLSLGDVMGKGMPSSLLTATVRAALRSVTHLPVSAAVEAVNRALSPDLMQSDSFITLFHASLESDSGQLTYVDAGHGMAFIQRCDGTVEPLRQSGLPIGILADASYPAGTTSMAPGDTLVIYSDGLPDARPELQLDPVGVSGLLDGLTNAQTKLDRLVNLVANVETRPDDLTLVLVQRSREPAVVGPASLTQGNPSQ
jgi:PAS domain S-box-containing protein